MRIIKGTKLINRHLVYISLGDESLFIDLFNDSYRVVSVEADRAYDYFISHCKYTDITVDMALPLIRDPYWYLRVKSCV
jgi:hypothetical protein